MKKIFVIIGILACVTLTACADTKQDIKNEKVEFTVTDHGGNVLTVVGEITETTADGRAVIMGTDSTGRETEYTAEVSRTEDGTVSVANPKETAALKPDGRDNISQSTNPPEPISEPETEAPEQPAETQGETKAPEQPAETEAQTKAPVKPAETEVPTEAPVKPAETQAPANPPETQATTQEAQLTVEEFNALVEDWTFYYINLYRQEEGHTLLTRNETLDRYCDIRVVQLHDNFAHDEKDMAAAAAQAGNKSQSEAIAGNGYDIPCKTEKIAKLWGGINARTFRNSPSHWAYVGQLDDFNYAGVGYDSGHVCVTVSPRKE